MLSLNAADVAPEADPKPGIAIGDVSRRFGDKVALEAVSLQADPGMIHALLGPNGAGKTTLLRVLTGLVAADGGDILVGGRRLAEIGSRRHRRLISLVPAGDRTFYLRLTGYENLIFFGRLQGLHRREAAERARQGLEGADLAEAAGRPVGLYSHGMQKRLSVARGLLSRPAVLLVDEATHDLDPVAAERVQDLISEAATSGTAVIWATQRLEEIRGFAQRVTVLDRGRVRFAGTVSQLVEQARPQRQLLRLRADDGGPGAVLRCGNAALGPLGLLEPAGTGDDEHCLLTLTTGVSLGDALTALLSASLQVLSCREERSEVSHAFLQLVGARQS